MTPTRVHYFFANNWPARMLMVAVPSLFVFFMARSLGPLPRLDGLEPEATSYLSLLGLALLIGVCVVALIGPFILGPIYHHRAQLNGAPFRTDDRVEVLVGAYSGQVVRVVEVRDWRGELRVEWDASVAHRSRTIFGFTEVMKVADAQPSAAPGASAPRRG